MAVKTFNGGTLTEFATTSEDENFIKNKQSLLSLLKSNRIEPKGLMEFYRYNQPWTIPAYKRNEVAVEVEDWQ